MHLTTSLNHIKILVFIATFVLYIAAIYSGLEIATDTGAFATKIFAFATKICRQVANLRPVCCRSFGHMLATGDYFNPKLIKEYHIEESCVLFINKKLKSSGKILLNLP